MARLQAAVAGPAPILLRTSQNSGHGGGTPLKERIAQSVHAEQRWASHIPLTGRALVLADDTVFVAGTPVAFPAKDLGKAYEGRMGGVVWAASAATGDKVAAVRLDALLGRYGRGQWPPLYRTAGWPRPVPGR